MEEMATKNDAASADYEVRITETRKERRTRNEVRAMRAANY